MSAKELVLPGGLTKMRVNDMHDGHGQVVFTIEANSKAGRDVSSMLCTLDRGQQHMLFLYLQERLNRS